MKAFEFRKCGKFDYPDDMELILNYLNERGKLNVSENRVESLYRKFSTNCYCAGWMGVNDVLEEFAEWLSDCDI